MLSHHAIARSVIPVLAGKLTGVFTENPLIGSAVDVLANGVNEWLGNAEGDAKLKSGLNRSVDSMAKALEASPHSNADIEFSIGVCKLALAEAAPEEVSKLLSSVPDKSAVAQLLCAQVLSDDDRDFAERILAEALRAWHKEIGKDNPVLGALREQLTEQHERITRLELAGLVYPQQHFDPAQYPPSQLFRPESGVLALIGRQRELAELDSWAKSEVGFALYAYTAPGGMGKTRLALEFLKRVRAQGWLAAFVSDASKLQLNSKHLPEQIALVLDYGDYRNDELKAVLVEAKKLVAAGKRVRLLVLARPDADWWKPCQLAVYEHFYADYEAYKPRLKPLTAPEGEADARVVRDVLTHVAKASGLDLKPDGFSLPAKGTPLIWMMAAYLHLHGGKPIESSSKLSQLIVLNHERKWLARKLGDDTYLNALMQALALFTFAGGVVDGKASEALLRSVPQLSDCDQPQINKLMKTLQSSYPRRQGIEALRPDLLGEYLCAEHLNEELMQVFVAWVLAMIAHHRNDRKDEIEWLLPLAQADQVCDRAGQWPEGSRAKTLKELWESALRNLPIEHIRTLASTNDVGHLRLRDLSERLSALHLERAGESVEERAWALNNRSVYLIEIGKPDAALAAAQEAVQLYGELAQERPDAFRPDLAMSLNTVANRLSEVGKPDAALAAAQEAVQLYGELAQERPDAFRPDLAMSLNNVASRLSEVGKPDAALAAAQEAVQLYGELAQERPDAFRPDLAMSLNNVASRLSEVGKPDAALAAAQEAVAIRRELAQERPDAFRPNLAASLNNVANRLSELGKPDAALAAAQEAVAIRRELAQERPDAFRPNLAASLNNVATFLSELGKPDAALAAAQEAVQLYGELAQERPDAFRPDLAMSLNNVATFLSEVGKPDAALAAAQEAVQLYGELAQERPDAFRPYLAGSLNNVANRLSELGKPDAALAAAQEAVTIRRELAQERPDAFRPDLAMSLNNVANRLSEVGKPDAALAAAQEAVTIRRELAQERPDAFRPKLAMGLVTLCQRLRENGLLEDACDAGVEAAGLFAVQWQQFPEAFERYTMMAIRETVASFEAAGKSQDQAIEALVESPAVATFLQAVSERDD